MDVPSNFKFGTYNKIFDKNRYYNFGDVKVGQF